jgi:catechol 2,3-dioxygenase-like lactoylglutathione lyase family enzyme
VREVTVKSEFHGHVGLRVSDLDRSVAFYGEAFGTRPGYEPGETSGHLIEEVFGLQATRFRFVHLLFPSGDGAVEPLEVTPAEDPPPGPLDTAGSVSHFAIYVDDIDECRERIQKAGGRLLSDPRPSPAGVDRWFFFCSDPDGHLIEVMNYRLSDTLASRRAEQQG